MQHVTLDEARTHLADLLHAAIRGEEVVITLDDQQMVRLMPVTAPETTPKGRPRFGSAKGLIVMSEDFDDPLPDFDEYMR